MTEPARILLVDDDPFTLMMLTSTLRSLGFIDVTAKRSITEAVSYAQQSQPTVAVLDLDLGEGPTGIDLAHRLRQLHPSIGIIILSTYAEPRLIGSNQRPLPSSAVYVVKQSIADTDALLTAIELCARNTDIDVTHVRRASPIGTLKDSQVEVMRLVASGMTNAQIAETMVMREESIEKAIARLIKQLGIKASSRQNQRVLIALAYYRLIKGANETADI
ncbi:MAG: hypothetical protein B7C54_06075 [Acidimicrobiales bacterium mtb01]|nr:response regulator transcription factor [Actinomycetota bacterium]TEX46756.1 MAG: hypothetical protein B7C54_06075 [Acidimicrobiales bacterium mtb01]